MNAENFATYLETPSKLYQLSYQELKNLAADYPFSANIKLLLALKSKMENDPKHEDYVHQLAASTFDRTYLRMLCLEEFPALTDLATAVEERLELKDLADLKEKELDYIPLDTSIQEAATAIAVELEQPSMEIPSPSLTDNKPIENTPVTPEENEDEDIPIVSLSKEAPIKKPKPNRAAFNALLEKPMGKTSFDSWQTQPSTKKVLKARFGKLKRAGLQKTAFQHHLNKVSQVAKKSLIEKPDLATETLAKLLLQQGQHKKALKMYEHLSLLFPEKRRYFAGIIEDLQQKS